MGDKELKCFCLWKVNVDPFQFLSSNLDLLVSNKDLAEGGDSPDNLFFIFLGSVGERGAGALTGSVLLQTAIRMSVSRSGM